MRSWWQQAVRIDRLPGLFHRRPRPWPVHGAAAGHLDLKGRAALGDARWSDKRGSRDDPGPQFQAGPARTDDPAGCRDGRRGKHTFQGYLSQSVLLGEAGLATRTRDFVGPFSAEPSFVIEETFDHVQDVAIPISELRLDWRYQVTRRLSLGLGVNASTWWDVPVPPGVLPGGGPKLHENTIVFYGLGGGLRVTL